MSSKILLRLLAAAAVLLALIGAFWLGQFTALRHEDSVRRDLARTPLALSRHTATVGLHVAGDHLQDAQGHLLLLRGVNRSGPEYACVQFGRFGDGPMDAASVAAMAAWHINAVRIPLNEDCALGINGANPAMAGAPYLHALAAYLSLLRQAHMVAILDLQWVAPGATLTRDYASGYRRLPDADHASAFWQVVATAFKTSDNVIFDLYNEPNPTDGGAVGWRCWRDGGAACPPAVAGVSYAVVGAQHLVDVIRATGATAPILVSGIQVANNVTGWLAYAPHDPLHNLLAAWHLYKGQIYAATGGSTTTYDRDEGLLAATVPLVATELGQGDCGDDFIAPFMSWADTHRVGYLAWSWGPTGAGCSYPGLIGDYNGTPSSPFGAMLRDHLLRLAGVAPPPSATPLPSPTPFTTVFPSGINVGGPTYTAADGVTYRADDSGQFTHGYLPRRYSSGDVIAETADRPLYRTGYGSQALSYRLGVPAGAYTLTLKLASTTALTMTPQGIDVYVNGIKYCWNWPYTASAPNCTVNGQPLGRQVVRDTAYDLVIPAVAPSDGAINLDVDGSYGSGPALLAAIRLDRAGRPPGGAVAAPRATGVPLPVAPITPTVTPGSVATESPLATLAPQLNAPPPPTDWLDPLISATASSTYPWVCATCPGSPYDALHGGTWRSSEERTTTPTHPQWIAFDLSRVPLKRRSTLRLVWTTPQTADYYNCGNGYDNPADYTVQGSSTPGGGAAPTAGWVTLVRVTGNCYHQMTHLLRDVGRYTWLRLFVTRTDHDQVFWHGVQLQVDLYNAEAPHADSWLFVGDSITLGGRGHYSSCDSTASSCVPWFSPGIHAVLPHTYPQEEWAGIGGTGASDACTRLSGPRGYLSRFDGRYVVIAYGTNDSNTGSTTAPPDATAFYNAMRCAVGAVLAHGMVPIVPTIPWNSLPASNTWLPLLNAQIERLYRTVPGLRRGPDLYSYFRAHPALILPDNLHPNGAGYTAMERLYLTWAVRTIYAPPLPRSSLSTHLHGQR